MQRKFLGILLSLLLIAATLQVFGFSNQPPTIISLWYEGYSNHIGVTAVDPDNDTIRYGISWNNSGIIDEWTEYHWSGDEVEIECWGHNNPAGVIAEDINGARSQWNSIKEKTKEINSQFITFLENHPHLFPLIRQILGI